MDRLYERVELFANIAIITIALLLGFILARTYIFNRTASTSEPNFKEMSVGEKISLEGTDWKANNRTLLLIVSKGCRYCGESAPFYRRLEEASSSNHVKMIAVLPQTPAEAREYLDGLNVRVGEIIQVNLSSIRVRGTPTLMLVDGSGTVINKWLGKVPPEVESDILAKIQCDTC